jgi:N-acetylglucosamine-6-phosphate deacetylase
MIVRGRHYSLNEVCDIDCAGGQIHAIGAPSRGRPDLGDEGCWLVPGLIDLQVNGYAGIDFCTADLTPEGVERACFALAGAGVTGFLPTIITNSREAITAAIAAVDAACRAGGAAGERILGIHLEGPYITPLDGPRGTHPREHTRPPDWAEFCDWQAASGERIRLITLAPELPGAMDFIRRAHASGVIVALGHHTATGEQIDAAVAAGAIMSTHLGNGSHAMLPRHLNYVWEQLANDALQASIIVDGHHLPPSVVKSFYRVKGPERLCLVSDVVWLAGMAPGRYRFGGQEVDLGEDGSVRLAGTAYLAGSALKLVDAIGKMMAYAGAPLAEAVDMASANPARLLDDTSRGRLEPGARADLLLVRERREGRGLELVATIVGGRVAFESPVVPTLKT